MQFVLKFLSFWFKVFENRTKRNCSRIASFTMGQNAVFNDILANFDQNK